MKFTTKSIFILALMGYNLTYSSEKEEQDEEKVRKCEEKCDSAYPDLRYDNSGLFIFGSGGMGSTHNLRPHLKFNHCLNKCYALYQNQLLKRAIKSAIKEASKPM